MVGAYTGEKWRNIRSAAMARDDRRCQSCGRRDRLHAHHITPVREFDSEADAHYLDNLVILCKRCHKIWEGRDARPRLADAEHGHTIPGVVGELVSDMLWRHCLPAALPEILSRHVAGDPAVCSKCFGILQGTPQFTAMKPFRETLRAVAFRERTLPSADPEDYTTPPVENYCDTCAEEYHTSWETFFGECQKPIRDKRADLLRRILGEVWDPTRHLIPIPRERVRLAHNESRPVAPGHDGAGVRRRARSPDVPTVRV